MFVDQAAAYELFKFYFDNCVVTYRVLNQQYCHSWLGHVLSNVHNGQPLEVGLGHAKAAIVVNILAIASLRQHKISETFSTDDGTSFPLQQSERYFLSALDLTARETGLPRLESAQARILQVLYLLQTSRMNQAWYVFGNTVPIVSALGLHRKTHRYRNGGRPQVDYIISECRKRTFWVVYTIDKYLAVVFGRPRFYHDNDIDQEYPDRVNDEDMTPQGPSQSEPAMDCHIDSLIFHARSGFLVHRLLDRGANYTTELQQSSKTYLEKSTLSKRCAPKNASLQHRVSPRNYTNGDKPYHLTSEPSDLRASYQHFPDKSQL